MKTFAQQVIEFYRNLSFHGKLPSGISIMNPFNENILQISSAFYHKYYSDHHNRFLILGINPGRFGAGVTGIPFTDTRRLKDICNIPYTGKETHEPSSVFIYDMMDAYGSAEKFFRRFYISAVCPLGFTAINSKGRHVNFNYYDSPALREAVYDFIVGSIQKQLAFGIERSICFCLGTGKNEKFLSLLNDRHHFFQKIIALEHPRFVMQYRARKKQLFIEKYLKAFKEIESSGMV